MKFNCYERLLTLIAVFGERALVIDVINVKKEMDKLNKKSV